MKKPMKIIQTDKFPFEFLSLLAEKESWRKEIHRPIYYLHKWWAKRLGSVFRGILLGCLLPEDSNFVDEFYRTHSYYRKTVFDPFMGSGTTIGEAHKLGLTALGMDINPVAVESVRVSLGPINQGKVQSAFASLSQGIGEKIKELYKSTDSQGCISDVLYYFWVMNVSCPYCSHSVDLFPSWVIARNAYPNRKQETQVLCPNCGEIFHSIHGKELETCRSCGNKFNPEVGTTRMAHTQCTNCNNKFRIIDAIGRFGTRPEFRLYGKLILNQDGKKEYLPASSSDLLSYKICSEKLRDEVAKGNISLPTLSLEEGYNTKQAMNYAFRSWRDFFNDRQLLCLGWLRAEIAKIADEKTRDLFLVMFSSILEFNNLFASYKGEGTGAVRHMFSHHVLKPERTPIEANIWGTPKSSGSFSNLFNSRLNRAIKYRNAPKEINIDKMKQGGEAIIASPQFTGKVESRWPTNGELSPRAIYIECGDSSKSELRERSIDFIVTDPPFFDNVHYSELADFFYAWQQLDFKEKPGNNITTRSQMEVQNSDPDIFASKLQGVLSECRRVLKTDGLLVFTYHHSRDEGWGSLARAIFGAGLMVINSYPVKSEMSVAVPKWQAKDPIQLDIIIVCRRKTSSEHYKKATMEEALESARIKIERMGKAGFKLSKNDNKIIIFGQLLTAVRSASEIEKMVYLANGELLAMAGFQRENSDHKKMVLRSRNR